MNKNVKIAKELIKLAKNLVAGSKGKIVYGHFNDTGSDPFSRLIKGLCRYGTYTDGVLIISNTDNDGVVALVDKLEVDLTEAKAVAQDLAQKINGIGYVDDVEVLDPEEIKQIVGYKPRKVVAVIWCEDAGWQDDPNGKDPMGQIMPMLQSVPGFDFEEAK